MNLYHGTTLKYAINILKEMKIKTEYFDGIGCYVADNITHSKCFGDFIFKFNKIDLMNKISQDDTNDGFLYSGALDLKKVSCSLIIMKSRITDRIIEENFKGHFFEILKNKKVKNGILFEIIITKTSSNSMEITFENKENMKGFDFLLQNIGGISKKQAMKLVKIFEESV